MLRAEDVKLAVIGLGYVGLPLAVEFGKSRKVVGFDINRERIDELKQGRDTTLEVDGDELAQARHLTFTTNLDDLKACNTYIITVPTPMRQTQKSGSKAVTGRQ